MSIAERLIKKRKDLGFTQTELATRAGLKPPAISQYESGARSPSYEALMKLSNALNISTDYLISGNEELISNNIFLRIVENMTPGQRDKLLEYAIFLTNNSNNINKNIHLLNNPSEYANYILKKVYNNFPVDVYKVAELLNISIYTQNNDREFEGTLIKGEEKIIIINDNIKNVYRKKFTIATLIGHSVIPWHLKFQYNIRKSGTSTLQTIDPEEMEAQNFAANLIMPAEYIEKNIEKSELSIENLKKMAYERFDVSLTVLLNRLVEINKNKYAIVYSNNCEITKTTPCNRILVDKILEGSVASSFSTNPNTSGEEEIRGGTVPAQNWFTDAQPNEIIYEQSIYNPKFGGVMTFLSIV